MDIFIDDRPKLFVFETEDEDIEINAMDFKDACLTLEEKAPNIKIQDIISIQEIHSPIPGHDTIHQTEKDSHHFIGRVAEQVDATDLKSVIGIGVWVRVPPRPPLFGMTARSSAGQSNGLLNRRSQVRILPGRPKVPQFNGKTPGLYSAQSPDQRAILVRIQVGPPNFFHKIRQIRG